MQGSIYTAFSDMIIEQMGMEQWNELIEKTDPPSQGIYTSGEQYLDSELINMVQALSVKTGIDAETLVEKFGRYLFKKLYDTSPVDISKIDNLKSFLLAIDGLIHVEVQRLHPKAYLPTFEYETVDENTLIMYYSSKRKLCHASVGLIYGAAEQFNEIITIEHPECIHQGATRCKLVINFKGHNE
ncbi:guanylate cyclase [Colwellia sp. 75C3]|uniref:heme NO-binding domain-containing protein n=1 Tax=Colwellia sp. 75C3 TaxID=888425 RepID=UPI000C3275B5|nr:heme NO-binding domain-containing protein [Colwellia sp. 75C3]PKG85818.1 guanylate cyclase [Colwellia sp. 75C3]